MKNYLVEFIGTFFLIFTIGCVVFTHSLTVTSATGIGFILMIMVYAGGHVSGGHYNPAVSLAAFMCKALPAKDLALYMVSQILGGVIAILTVIHFMVPTFIPGHATYHLRGLIIGEFLFTFALCYVVLMTAVDKKVEGNSYFGLAIGSTVLVGILAVGSFCMAAFNPAVAISLGAIGAIGWKSTIVTIIVNFIAATVAALTYKMVSD